MTEPPPIEIAAPEVRRGEGEVAVCWENWIEPTAGPIEFKFLDGDVNPAHLGEAGVAVALYLGMATGRPIRSEVPVDVEFRKASGTIQDVRRRWLKDYSKIEVEAPVREPDRARVTPPWEPARNGAAVMFSGGVDSFFSAVELEGQVQTAIYIHGFDTKLEDVDYRAQISRRLQAACADLGLQLIEIETNLRDTSDELCPWFQYHGAMLAAVSHMLAGKVERIYIPSSYTYEQLSDCGSHPFVDPLWSSGDLSFVHHGAETGRVAKVERVSRSEVARQHLRVCWENVDEAYNCGRCEKCIRTSINLRIVKADEAFRPLFGHWPEISEIVPHVCTPNDGPLLYLSNTLHEARRRDIEPEIAEEIEKACLAAECYHLTKGIAALSGRDSGDYFVSEQWRGHILPKVRRQLFGELLAGDPEHLFEHSGIGRDQWFELLWSRNRRWFRGKTAERGVE